MDAVLEFMKVFGALVLCVLLVIVMAVIMADCALRMRRMEKRMVDLEEFIRTSLSGVRSESRADNFKQRRVMSENMANFSESMTRAILSLNDERADSSPEKQA